MKKLSWFYKYFLFKLKKKNNIDLYFFDNNKSLDGLLNYFGSDKGTAGKNPLTVTPQEAQKLAANPAVQKAAAQSNTNPMDLISRLMPGRGPVTGQ